MNELLNSISQRRKKKKNKEEIERKKQEEIKIKLNSISNNPITKIHCEVIIKNILKYSIKSNLNKLSYTTLKYSSDPL